MEKKSNEETISQLSSYQKQLSAGSLRRESVLVSSVITGGLGGWRRSSSNEEKCPNISPVDVDASLEQNRSCTASSKSQKRAMW